MELAENEAQKADDKAWYGPVRVAAICKDGGQKFVCFPTVYEVASLEDSQPVCGYPATSAMVGEDTITVTTLAMLLLALNRLPLINTDCCVMVGYLFFL